jgi:hypothetical protein
LVVNKNLALNNCKMYTQLNNLRWAEPDTSVPPPENGDQYHRKARDAIHRANVKLKQLDKRKNVDINNGSNPINNNSPFYQNITNLLWSRQLMHYYDDHSSIYISELNILVGGLLLFASFAYGFPRAYLCTQAIASTLDILQWDDKNR